MNVVIKSWLQKESKKTGKPFFIFNEEYYVFDLELAQELMQMKDKEILLKIKDKDGFKSIEDYKQATKPAGTITPTIKPADEVYSYNTSIQAPLSMWVSYAKDILCAMIQSDKGLLTSRDGMILAVEESVRLVKLARNKLKED